MSVDTRAAAVALNEVQLRVLEWVADGCPEGVMVGYSHRTTARALQRRELVRVRGHGPSWQASLTPAGRAWLDGERPMSETGRPPATMTKASGLSKTEQLVADVQAAGGRLVLPDETARGGVNWRQRAYAAQRAGKVPNGMHLTCSWTQAGFELELVAGATGNEQGAPDVQVPERVGRYHPTARRFRERTDLQEVSRRALPRAARIVHALATELQARGHRLECVPAAGRNTDYSPARQGQLIATLHGHEVRVRLREGGVGMRGPWEESKRRREEQRASPRLSFYYPSGPVEAYDKGATGALELELVSTWSRRQTKWGDRQRWKLEDRLGQVIRELEAFAQDAEEARLERERQAAERHRQWEQAMAHAREQALLAHRRQVLTGRVAAWEEADRIRAYCQGVSDRHGDEADEELAAWLVHAEGVADQLQRAPRMPPEPELTHEDLKPYLGGWSPYGPERGRW